MKWLCVPIALGFMALAFHFVWVNRVETHVINPNGLIIFVNKWTGGQCVFHPNGDVMDEYRSSFNFFGNLCEVRGDLSVVFP